MIFKNAFPKVARDLALRLNKEDFWSGKLRKVVMHRSALLSLRIGRFIHNIRDCRPSPASTEPFNHEVPRTDRSDDLNTSLSRTPLIYPDSGTQPAFQNRCISIEITFTTKEN